MPTATQIQNTILQSQVKAAYVILANTTAEQGGATNVDWIPATRWFLNITALQNQYDLGDYTSAGCIQVYDCLNFLLGQDTSIITIDPNYQPPSGTIIVTNPQSYLQPVVLTSADFDITGTYYTNSNWKGINPFMVLSSPANTSLVYGVDYSLLPNGGFTLLSTGNLPNISPGQEIVVYSYSIA